MNPLRAYSPARTRAGVAAEVERFPWHACGAPADWRWGVPQHWLRRFCRDWSEAYDWDGLTRRFDGIEYVRTSQQGAGALYLPGPAAAPLIILQHGWPSTVLEYIDLARALQAAGHAVLVPALPGAPLGQPCAAPVSPADAARSVLALVERTGHDDFIAHGGDWGADISVWLGLLAPGKCRGVHIAMSGPAGNEPAGALQTIEERKWRNMSDACYRNGGAYMDLQSRETATAGYLLAGSAVAMAAWICDKFLRWTDDRGKGPARAEAIIGRSFLLDTLSLFALTETVASALWLYPGHDAGQQAMPRRLDVPTGIFRLPNDPVFPWPPRSLLERHYDVVHWTEPPHGAHFAALEVPELLEQDLLAFAASLSWSSDHLNRRA